MRSSGIFKVGTIVAALSVLCPTMVLGDLSVVLNDNFDDGNYDGWTVGDPFAPPGSDIRAPAIVSSPEGYALRGTGSGYGANWCNELTRNLSLNSIGRLTIEMRAKSGPQLPNQVYVQLGQGDWPNQTEYMVVDYGEGNRAADWVRYTQLGPGAGDQDLYRWPIGNRAYEWHTFAWTRDRDGWWSLSIDGLVEAPRFRQDASLTSFDGIVLTMFHDQSELEWVRVSAEAVPLPGAVVLGAIGLGFANYLLKRRSVS